MQKGTVAFVKRVSQNQETKLILRIKTETKKKISITEGMQRVQRVQKVIDTLSDKEKAIVCLLLKNGGPVT